MKLKTRHQPVSLYLMRKFSQKDSFSARWRGRRIIPRIQGTKLPLETSCLMNLKTIWKSIWWTDMQLARTRVSQTQLTSSTMDLFQMPEYNQMVGYSQSMTIQDSKRDSVLQKPVMDANSLWVSSIQRLTILISQRLLPLTWKRTPRHIASKRQSSKTCWMQVRNVSTSWDPTTSHSTRCVWTTLTASDRTEKIKTFLNLQI